MAYADGKYAEKEWLRKQYREKTLSQKEIAEKTEVTQATVSNWIEKFDLTRKWHDEEVLRELYVEKGLSTPEIAQRLGLTSHQAIIKGLRDNDIEVTPYRGRSTGYGKVRLKDSRKGHVFAQHNYDGETYDVFIHRLTAVAEFGWEEATRENTVVHHKNCIGWDNRPSNLKVMRRDKHTRLHNNPRRLRSLDPEWSQYKLIRTD